MIDSKVFKLIPQLLAVARQDDLNQVELDTFVRAGQQANLKDAMDLVHTLYGGMTDELTLLNAKLDVQNFTTPVNDMHGEVLFDLRFGTITTYTLKLLARERWMADGTRRVTILDMAAIDITEEPPETVWRMTTDPVTGNVNMTFGQELREGARDFNDYYGAFVDVLAEHDALGAGAETHLQNFAVALKNATWSDILV